MATQIQLQVFFGGKSHSHPSLVKPEAPKESIKTKRKAEIVSLSVLSKVLAQINCHVHKIWKIEKEKDRKRATES